MGTSLSKDSSVIPADSVGQISHVLLDEGPVPPDSVADRFEGAQASQMLHDEGYSVRGSTLVTEDAVTASSRAPSPNDPLRVAIYNIPTSERYFWKESMEQQLALAIFDKYPEQVGRPMPKYEILVMALNEIAVHHAYGFFFHLPFQDGQLKAPSEELCPPSRRPPAAYILPFTQTRRQR